MPCKTRAVQQMPVRCLKNQAIVTRLDMHTIEVVFYLTVTCGQGAEAQRIGQYRAVNLMQIEIAKGYPGEVLSSDYLKVKPGLVRPQRQQMFAQLKVTAPRSSEKALSSARAVAQIAPPTSISADTEVLASISILHAVSVTT